MPDALASQIFLPDGYSATPIKPADEVMQTTYFSRTELYLSFISSMLFLKPEPEKPFAELFGDHLQIIASAEVGSFAARSIITASAFF